MLLIRTISSLTLAVALSLPLAAADLTAAVKQYHAAGRMVVDQINAGTLDVAATTAKVIEIERQAVTLARAYAAKHPTGAKLIDHVISQAVTLDAKGEVTGLGPMAALPFKTIEDEWHDLGHYKTNPQDAGGIDLALEDNEHFTDPLHTIIHPIMVVAAARDFARDKKPDTLAAAKGEMEEGIEQAEKTATAAQ
jgi:hypothetical protein